MKKEIIGYKCKNCGKDKGLHKSNTLECPLPGKSSFKSFSTDKYTENFNKPIYGFNL